MTPTRRLIQFGLSNVPNLVTLLHALKNLLLGRDLLLRESIDVDALNALSHVQILIRWRYQVIDALVIDLHKEGQARIFIAVNNPQSLEGRKNTKHSKLRKKNGRVLRRSETMTSKLRVVVDLVLMLTSM